MTTAAVHSFVKKIIAPLKRRVMLMVSRALVTIVDDGANIQLAQVMALAGEVKDDLERLQQYGFTSVPLPGAEALVVFIGGNRDHGVITNVDDRLLRKKGLSPGDSAMYDAMGNYVHLANGAFLDISTLAQIIMDTVQAKITASLKTTIESPLVDIGKGALEPPLNGVTFQTGYNLHTHTVFGIPTTPVNTPSTPADLSTQVKLGK